MPNNPLIHDGLLPKTPDDRDHLGGTLFDLEPLSSLPVHYTITGDWQVKNQGATDFCAAYSSCYASQYQEDVELDPNFTFMMSKVLTGDPESWGQQLRDIARTHVKYGALETMHVPLSVLGSTDREKLVNIENWGDIKTLLDKSIVHKKDSFFFVTGNTDNFDNIKRTLWHFRNEERAVVFGTLWDNSWSLEMRIIDTLPTAGFGHALCVVGFTQENGVEYLIVQNSWGDNSIRGRHLFSREVINRGMNIYGGFMFSDIPKERQAWFMENGIKSEMGWLPSILIAMWKAIISLMLKRQKLLPPTPEKEVLPYVPPPPVEPIVLPIVEPVKPEVLKWDTKANVRHSVRVMCDNAGLAVSEKNIITATVQAESGFDNNAVCKNKNAKGEVTSSDWGVAQINDYWHTGKGRTFPSAKYVVDNPNEAIAFMIKMFKVGKLHLWIAYRTGAYKKYL